MPLYLTCFSYTPETWKAMIERPEDRRDMARDIIESVGGRLHGFWYAFGQHDGYTLWEAPDNVKMASVALALSSRGAIKSQETVVPSNRRGDPRSDERSSTSALSSPGSERLEAEPVYSLTASVGRSSAAKQANVVPNAARGPRWPRIHTVTKPLRILQAPTATTIHTPQPQRAHTPLTVTHISIWKTARPTLR